MILAGVIIKNGVRWGLGGVGFHPLGRALRGGPSPSPQLLTPPVSPTSGCNAGVTERGGKCPGHTSAKLHSQKLWNPPRMSCGLW